jgi:diguanylate cyclase (GGDEF)-like protein
MWGTLNEKGCWYGEIWNKRKNGQIYPELLTITAVTDDAGTLIHYIGDFCEISENKLNEVEIRRLSYFDPLTNLPNLHLLEVLMAQAMLVAKRNLTHGAIFVISLNRSESVGNTFGNSNWDELRIEVANCIKSAMRGNDTVARHNVEDFVVVLEHLDLDESVAAVLAEQVAEKLRLSISTFIELSDYQFSHKLFIGATLFSSSDSFNELLANAELALCDAKKNSRGATRFFKSPMHSKGSIG